MKKNQSAYLKAGGWYTIANFINKGVSMLLMPFLARMMTKKDYGDFSNFSAWASMIVIITSLDMANVIVRSKLDYEDDFDSFMSSIVVTTLVFTSIFSIILVVFRGFFTDLFGFGDKYIYALIIFLFFHPAISYFTGKQIAWLKYKSSTIVSLSSSILILVLSLLLVNFSSDKLWARTLTYVGVPAVYGIVIYIIFLGKSLKIDIKKIIYTLKLSIPLIPHNLSNGILGSSDRVFINKYWPSEYTALYSVGYNIGNLLYLFTQSIGQAYTPWLYERLKKQKYNNISVSNTYLSVIGLLLICLVIGLTPEAVLIAGGSKYNDAIPVVPIVTVGVYFQFISKLYINIEHYVKKTYMISVASVLAAAMNLGLNYLLVPKFGYIAAAWTTLISYIAALFLHAFMVKKTDYSFAINTKMQMLLGLVSLILIPFSSFLYTNLVIRIIFVLVTSIVSLAIVLRIWKKIKGNV